MIDVTKSQQQRRRKLEEKTNKKSQEIFSDKQEFFFLFLNLLKEAFILHFNLKKKKTGRKYRTTKF